MPPGPYRLAFDLVLEGRYWLSEIGNEMLTADVDVGRRDATGAVAHLPAEVEPAADWHELVRAAHEEGFAAVGGAIESRERALRPYRPGGGRNPSFPEPLVCPSLLPPLDAELRGRRPPGLAAGGLGAVDLRRPDQGPASEVSGSRSSLFEDQHTACGVPPRYNSTAIRSSTRLNTQAPSASAITASTTR